MRSGNPFHITGLAKIGGPLTKRISLSPEGKLISDGSACVMTDGWAKRMPCESLNYFADLISDLDPNEAIALGTLRRDLPETVRVTTKDKLEDDRAQQPDVIARISEFIAFEPDVPALALIDIDTKGMPPSVRNTIDDLGGYLPALISVIPEMTTTARVIRRSTSTGISRTDTGEALPGSSGLHIFLMVQDGGDIERFLRTFHDRCWLAGLGWHMVGAGGQLLDRSLVDKMVYAPERLVFEGAPQLVPPLVQDKASRRPAVYDGTPLDTRDKCPTLTLVEKSKLDELKARSGHSLKPERAKVRDAFVDEHADKLVKRSGGMLGMPAARRIIRRQCEGCLLPSVVLPWDDKAFEGCTVLDVLKDPARFVGVTMADPLEGPEYGRCKAKVMCRADGSPWIHSFAHGRTVYDLKYDAKTAAEIIDGMPPDQVADAFVEIIVIADMEPDEIEALRNKVAAIAGVTKRALDRKLKEAKQEHTSKRRAEERERKAADRVDHRPQIPAPNVDSPWLPQMQVLNDVLGSSALPEPPMRDIDGVVTQVRVRRIPNMHALTSQGANEGEAPDAQQPATEQPLLTRLDETRLAELIEHHIDYIDDEGQSVHLGTPFVKHFHTRTDDVLPTVAAIATLPIVLPDGTLLAERGLDRKRGIVFRVPPDLLAVIPKPEECTRDAVAKAMHFLTEVWLCDVSTDYAGKCILIAAALSIIERSVLPERPAFFVTAGRRGGGKTTALIMLLMAVTGVRPSAAAWSPNEEERRKSLLSYLMEALPAIIWDNIPRGTQISCPHIEKSCTTAFYSDRRLGVSEMVAVSASVVHLFTGNNVGPRGDLASRSLQVRLEVDRHDPENRPFKHPDPIGWTEANRGKILRALYVLLLGNPALKPSSQAVPQTRFKGWWRLVGSAVEHAAAEHARISAERVAALVDDMTERPPMAVNFRDLFLSQEEDDEESTNLSDVLAALSGKWDNIRFQASDVAQLLNYKGEYQSADDKERAAVLREFLFPKLPANQDVSAKSVGRMIKNHIGEPVKAAKDTLILKEWRDPRGGAKGPLSYYVQSTPA